MPNYTARQLYIHIQRCVYIYICICIIYRTSSLKRCLYIYTYQTYKHNIIYITIHTYTLRVTCIYIFTNVQIDMFLTLQDGQLFRTHCAQHVGPLTMLRTTLSQSIEGVNKLRTARSKHCVAAPKPGT